MHRNRFPGIPVLATTLAALLPTAARAQYYPGVVYNRPSQNLTYNIETIGGLYTRSSLTTAQPGPQGVASLGGRGVGNLLPPGGRPGGFVAGLGPAIEMPQIGFTRYARGADASYVDSGRVSQSELMWTSGAAAATRLENPGMRRVFAVPRKASLLHAAPQPEDQFSRFFGLKPISTEPPPPPDASVIAALESGSDARLASLRESALRAFREERYDDALPLLSSVRRTDRSDYLAPLLAFHAALATDRLSLATTNLLLAVERRPSMFVDAEDISAYFGSAERYQEVLRRYSRLPPDSHSKALVIKSYCAWRLGDKATARAAIDAAVAASRETDDEWPIRYFAEAIGPALN